MSELHIHTDPGPARNDMTPLASYTADHRRLVAAAARVAELIDPIVFTPSGYAYYLLKSAVRGPLIPLEGVLLRDWTRYAIRHSALHRRRDPFRAVRGRLGWRLFRGSL